MANRRHNQRPEYLRATIADEAARIMQESGLGDYRAAKAKAVERMGLGRQAPLPRNAEIEAALAERNRVFRGRHHDEQLRQLRTLAADLMSGLQAFHPRLVGAVLSGHATDHSGIDLHLFADAAEAVGERLTGLGLRHRAILCRHRWRRGEDLQLPGYRFVVDGTQCLVSVFPERRRAHAPLSPIDGRPMRRANLRELQELLAASG